MKTVFVVLKKTRDGEAVDIRVFDDFSVADSYRVIEENEYYGVTILELEVEKEI